MSGFSTSLANAIIETTLNGAAFMTIRNRYFALFTADPTDAFTAGQEVSAAWYTRMPTGAFHAATNGTTYNNTSVEFPAVTDAEVTVTHVGIVEGASDSDGTSTLLYSHALPSPQVMAIGGIYRISTGSGAGDYTLTLV